MKIYLETKDKDNHRIVFVSDNGKLVFCGEWQRRKAHARITMHNFLWFMQGIKRPFELEERPYKPGSFANNSGPKKKAVKSTSKRK